MIPCSAPCRYLEVVPQFLGQILDNNVYVKERILAATKSTNILQEEEDKNLSLASKRLKALQEEIAGFFNSAVLKRDGEFFHSANFVLPKIGRAHV